jgi:hypothetical protein
MNWSVPKLLFRKKGIGLKRNGNVGGIESENDFLRGLKNEDGKRGKRRRVKALSQVCFLIFVYLHLFIS